MLFQSVIRERLYHHCFQPIVDIQQQTIFGYESLLRSKHVGNPEVLFDVAIDLNKLLELDISSFNMTIHTFTNQLNEENKAKHLFVNVYPSTLISSLFMSHLENIIKNFFIPPNKIILELSESEPIACYSQLRNAITLFKEFGVKIALDDLGKGNSSLKNIVELEPDYVKFDKYFAENLTQSIKKQHLLESLSKFCCSNNIQTILEGIESEDDLQIAKSLGIHYGQGYLFGKPKRIIM